MDLLSDGGAVGGIVLYDAERAALTVVHNAADFLVISDAGDGPKLVKPVNRRGVPHG